MSLEITEVRINKLSKSKGSILAFAKITFNNDFVIDGIKIINGPKGTFIGMPSKEIKGEDSKKEFKDICYPINKETRKMITQKILDAYDKTDSASDPF